MKSEFSNKIELIHDGYNEGFVLPYVILVIAILSISTILLGERLQSVTQNISVIESEFDIELALLNAESEATYAILTGKPKDFALDINPLTPEITLLDILADENLQKDVSIPPDLWSVIGGVRRANQGNQPVAVHLQDVSGLIPLNFDTDMVEKFLISSGFSKNKARALSAKLNDYVDPDNKRQFLGAERSDYRLRRRAAPSNSSLRNFDELLNVLGWEEVFDDLDLYRFMDMTSLHSGRGLIESFMPPELLEVAESGPAKLDDRFGFDEIFASTEEPSGAYRLSLWVNSGGRYKKRVLEINKQSSNFISPFKRVLVYERTLNSPDVEFDITGLKNVINALPNTQ